MKECWNWDSTYRHKLQDGTNLFMPLLDREDVLVLDNEAVQSLSCVVFLSVYHYNLCDSTEQHTYYNHT